MSTSRNKFRFSYNSRTITIPTNNWCWFTFEWEFVELINFMIWSSLPSFSVELHSPPKTSHFSLTISPSLYGPTTDVLSVPDSSFIQIRSGGTIKNRNSYIVLENIVILCSLILMVRAFIFIHQICIWMTHQNGTMLPIYSLISLQMV